MYDHGFVLTVVFIIVCICRSLSLEWSHFSQDHTHQVFYSSSRLKSLQSVSWLVFQLGLLRNDDVRNAISYSEDTCNRLRGFCCESRAELRIRHCSLLNSFTLYNLLPSLHTRILIERLYYMRVWNGSRAFL